MTVLMEIQREGRAVAVEPFVSLVSEKVSDCCWSKAAGKWYRLTAEEKAFAMNLALEKLEKQNDKSR